MSWNERYSGKIKDKHTQLVNNFNSDMNAVSYGPEDGGSFTNTVDGHMAIHDTASTHAKILYDAHKKEEGAARQYLWSNYINAQSYSRSAKHQAEELAKPQLF
jgi:hypothetical protein